MSAYNTYIQPCGEIDLMWQVPLNPKQEDTMYFANVQYRDIYFEQYVLVHYDEQSYSRPTKGSVRVTAAAGNLYRCNYMRFKNIPAFQGQWIYAFIIAVEYVNNNTADVFYVIDDMVTWFPQCTLKECFVEREIPETDNYFENLIPENLDIGMPIKSSYIPIDLGDPVYMLTCATDMDGKYGYNKINGVYTPLKYYFCSADGVLIISGHTIPDIAAYVENYYQTGNNPENIVSIHLVPTFFFEYSTGHPLPPEDEIITKEEEYDLPFGFDGYTPKNKKLFSYPYTYISATNNSGQSVNWLYEKLNPRVITDYGSPHLTLKLMACTYGLPTIMLMPDYYDGSDNNLESSLTMTNFPIAPYVCDTYKAYLAQNKASINASITSTVIDGLTSVIGSAINGVQNKGIENNIGNDNPVGQLSAQGGVQKAIFNIGATYLQTGAKIGQIMAKVTDMKSAAATVSNLGQSDALLALSGRMRFDVFVNSIKYETAKNIDDYFSIYGYAQHKVKVPNINSRPFWNYTKTVGCVVTGQVPASALASISSIFDRGIRFWKDMKNIGNYELNNSPT